MAQAHLRWVHVVAMPPTAFLKRPYQWLKALSHFRGTVSGGPNFAYELCTSKVTDVELETLDLRSWRMAYCAAEPVRARTFVVSPSASPPADSAPRPSAPVMAWQRPASYVSAGDFRTRRSSSLSGSQNSRATRRRRGDGSDGSP